MFYQVIDEECEVIVSVIDIEELIILVLILGNIFSCFGEEVEVGEFVCSWLDEQGFIIWIIGVVLY